MSTPAARLSAAAQRLREHGAYVRRLGITTAAGGRRPNFPEFYEGVAAILEAAAERNAQLAQLARNAVLVKGWPDDEPPFNPDDDAALAVADLVLAGDADDHA